MISMNISNNKIITLFYIAQNIIAPPTKDKRGKVLI